MRRGATLLFAVFAVCAALWSAERASACSLAVLDDSRSRIVARNMDWMVPYGVVVKNGRGVEKTATFTPPGSIPYTWTSRYGSVTLGLLMDLPGMPKFTMPGCGLNEAGFYAAALWVDEPPAVLYPDPGERPAVVTAEVARVLLDTCGSVEEAIARLDEIGVTLIEAAGEICTLHWFLADSTGANAVVEYPDGKLTVRNPPKYEAMTNNFYEYSHEVLSGYEGFGGDKPIPDDAAERTSENRFVRACHYMLEAEKKGSVSVDDGFVVMDKVKQHEGSKTSTSRTQWSVVYDLGKRSISWIAASNDMRRTIRMDALTFPSNTTASVDIQSSGEGDVTALLQDSRSEGVGCDAGIGALAPFFVVPLFLAMRRGR